MANDLLVPVLGLGRGEGTLVGWYREDGEHVSAGDLVFCFESGNVAVDVEAPEDGYVWHEASAGSQPRWGEPVGVVLASGETFIPREGSSFAPATDFDAPPSMEPAAEPEPDADESRRYSFEEYEVRPAPAPSAPEPITPAALPLLRRRHDNEPDEPANGFWGPSAPGDQTEFDSPLLWRSASEAWPWGRDDDGQARRRRLLPVRPVSSDEDDGAPAPFASALNAEDDWGEDTDGTPEGEWEPATPSPAAWSDPGEGDGEDAPPAAFHHHPAPLVAEPRWDDTPPPPLTWNFEPTPASATWAETEPAAEPERLFDDGQWEVVAEPAEWDTPAPAAWPPAPTTAFAWDAPAPGSLAERMPSWDTPEETAAQPLPPLASEDPDGDWQPLSEEVEPWPAAPFAPPLEPAYAEAEAAFAPEAPFVPAFEARGDVVEPWDDPAGNADPVAVTLAAPARAAALWLRTEVPAAGLVEVQHHLGVEWGGPGPGVAVLLASAMGRALAEFGNPGADVLLDTPARPEAHRAILRAAGERPMRELVDDALSHCPHDALFDCALTDFGAAGVDEGVAPIAEGQPFGLAAGSVRDILSFVAGRPALSPVVTLTLSYDPALVSPGDAAWFLGRVRALCEAPHALLAA